MPGNKISQPMVSIIMPTYNSEKFILETINSVLNQSYTNLEIIIIDDGSIDNTILKIKSIEDKRIKLLHRNKLPKGASKCRNIGIKESKGKYIIFLDSDDLIDKNAIKNRVKLMQEKDELDFISFSTAFFYNKIGDSKRRPHFEKKKHKHLEQFLLLSPPWFISGPIWKKSFLEELDGFDERFQRFQDTEFHLCALLKENVKYESYSNVDVHYRIIEDKQNHVKKSIEYRYKILQNLIRFENKFITSKLYKVLKKNKKEKVSYKLLFILYYRNYLYFYNKSKKLFEEFQQILNAITNDKYRQSKIWYYQVVILKAALKCNVLPTFLKKVIFKFFINK